MSTTTGVTDVCELDGCTNPIEPVRSGEARRYCSPTHRRIARKVRRDLLDAAAPHPSEPPPAPTRSVASYDRAPGPRPQYRRLVPEPRPRWLRRSAFVPFAARGVRPMRPLDPQPLFALPEWLRPHSPHRASEPPTIHGADIAPALPAPPQAAPTVTAPSRSEWARPTAYNVPTARPDAPPSPAPIAMPPSTAIPTATPSSAANVGAAWVAHAGALGRRMARTTAELPAALSRRRIGVSRRDPRADLENRRAAAMLRGEPLPDGITTGSTEASLTATARLAPQMREAMHAALHSLSNNRLRALLTTIGIVVGVAAVIVLVALGNGMKANFNTQFSKLANQITITPATGAVPDGESPRNLTDRDVTALSNPRRAPSVASVSPAVTGSVTLTAGQAKDKATLVGAAENYLEMVNRKVAAGHWFTEAQINSGARTAVLGQQALHLLWGAGVDPAQVIGKPIRLSHTTFKVQAVLASDGQDDNTVIVPFSTARAYLVGNNGGKVDQIIVKSTGVDNVAQAAREATAILDDQHLIRTPTSRDFNVKTFTELLKQSTQFINFLTMFIVAVAAISLLVGGVGVANIMLVSVTERTREIGIRKAVGAKTTAILRQFLSEAVLLTGLGGLVGVVLGVALTVAGTLFLPSLQPSIPVPILTLTPILIAFGVSLVIGVLAGGYPANRAARLRPIDALRFE